FSSRRRHTSSNRDWSSDVCSSDLGFLGNLGGEEDGHVPSVQLGLLVQRGDLGALLRELEQQALSDVRVRHLAAPESDGDLHPVEIGRASRRESVYMSASAIAAYSR